MGRRLLAAYTVVALLFVFAPILVSFVFSFSFDRFPSLPFSAFSTKWYAMVWADPDVNAALRRSLLVSTIVAVVSTAIGFGAAYVDYRHDFSGKWLYLALGFLPPVVPILILGVAMLFFMSEVGLSGHLYSTVLCHVVICIPFAMSVIRLRLSQVNPSLESAAWNLGAGPWRALAFVVVPLCLPAILAALFVTAAISFDEYAIVWFVSGLEETLPVKVLNFIQGQASPRINAVGSVTFTISIMLVVAAQLLMLGRRRKAQGLGR